MQKNDALATSTEWYLLTLSAFHSVAWSTIPDIVRAGVVQRWEAAENLSILDDRMDEPADATVVNCWFCGMSL